MVGLIETLAVIAVIRPVPKPGAPTDCRICRRPERFSQGVGFTEVRLCPGPQSHHHHRRSASSRCDTFGGHRIGAACPLPTAQVSVREAPQGKREFALSEMVLDRGRACSPETLSIKWVATPFDGVPQPHVAFLGGFTCVGHYVGTGWMDSVGKIDPDFE